jgi:hypothetical protein
MFWKKKISPHSKVLPFPKNLGERGILLFSKYYFAGNFTDKQACLKRWTAILPTSGFWTKCWKWCKVIIGEWSWDRISGDRKSHFSGNLIFSHFSGHQSFSLFFRRSKVAKALFITFDVLKNFVETTLIMKLKVYTHY